MEVAFLAGLNVLYVEDEPVLREEITTFLKRRVNQVIVAENGKIGLDKFATHPVDFIITDLKMPVLDGIEMSREIRKTNSNIPIIITTALSDVELMQTSIELGISRYILKPIEGEAFNQALLGVCHKLQKTQKKSHISLSIEASKLLERKIETEVAKIIKATSGKGPSKVQAFVRANLVEITIQGSRTPIEQTILTNDKNVRIGDYMRDIYYGQIKKQVEQHIQELSGFNAVWQSQKCDSVRDVDHIKLIIEIEG